MGSRGLKRGQTEFNGVKQEVMRQNMINQG